MQCRSRCWVRNLSAATELCHLAWDIEAWRDVCLHREADEVEGELLAADIQARGDLLNLAAE